MNRILRWLKRNRTAPRIVTEALYWGDYQPGDGNAQEKLARAIREDGPHSEAASLAAREVLIGR